MVARQSRRRARRAPQPARRRRDARRRSRCGRRSPLLLAAGGRAWSARVAIAFAVSPIGPLGTVRSPHPSPGPSLPGAAVASRRSRSSRRTLGVVIVAVARSGRRGESQRRRTPSRSGRAPGALVARRGRPAVSTGMGAALDARRAGAGIAAMLGCVVATAAAATAHRVRGQPVRRSSTSPQSYGWPWDVAVITGGGLRRHAIRTSSTSGSPRHDVRDDVVDHALLQLRPLGRARRATGADGLRVGDRTRVDTDLPVLEGRDPAGARRGAARAGHRRRARPRASATTVTIESRRVRRARPARSSASACSRRWDRSSPTRPASAPAPSSSSTPSPSAASALAAVHRHPAARRRRSVRRARPTRTRPADVERARRAARDPRRARCGPPEIVNVSELRLAPLVLGGLLLASLTLGLWLAVTLSVRDRRRELAVLRAVGFGDRDVRRSRAMAGPHADRRGPRGRHPARDHRRPLRLALLRRPPRRGADHHDPRLLAGARGGGDARARLARRRAPRPRRRRTSRPPRTSSSRSAPVRWRGWSGTSTGARCGAGRRRATAEPELDEDAWPDLEHSPYTFEGRVEQMGTLARGMRRGRGHRPAVGSRATSWSPRHARADRARHASRS